MNKGKLGKREDKKIVKKINDIFTINKYYTSKRRVQGSTGIIETDRRKEKRFYNRTSLKLKNRTELGNLI